MNIESHGETKEPLEHSSDKEEETDKTNTVEKDSSDSRTDVSITFNTSHSEKMSKPFEEELIDENLHFDFELITELSDPTEETKSNGGTIAEEHFTDTDIENADQRRQANLQKTYLIDKKDLR